MKKFKIVCDKTGKEYVINKPTRTDARHWIINHLDVSINYSITEVPTSNSIAA